MVAPLCVTVKISPATITTPVRVVVDGLAATDMATVPEPVPLAADVTVIHPALLVAVHAHVLAVASDVVAGPPSPVTDADVGASV